MEENKEIQEQEPNVMEQHGYTPRPKWQIAAAWVGLAIVVTGVVLYYIHIATGG